MFSKGVWWLAAATVMVAASAAAQTPTMRRVEFDEAVRTALERNPTVASAATAIAQAEGLLQQSRSTIMPSVNAGAQLVTAEAARGFEDTTTQPRSQFLFSVTATVPILAAAQRAGINQARDQIAVATLATDDIKRQVGVAAAQAYLAVIASQRQVDVARRALDTAAAHLDYATKRLQGGVGSRLNELRAAQEASRDRATLENSGLALRRAQEALGVLLGENGPVDAGAVPVLEIPLADAREASDGWMESRPDLQRDAAAIRAAERVSRDARKAWWPSAQVSFEPRLVAPAGLFQPSRSYQLVFAVSQRIFDRGQRAVNALNRVALDRALFTRTTTEISARSEVRLARESAASYERAAASARQAAEQANEVLRITTQAFEVGATTNIEVIDAQRSARDAETIATVAEDAVRRAKLDLLVALGQFPR